MPGRQVSFYKNVTIPETASAKERAIGNMYILTIIHGFMTLTNVRVFYYDILLLTLVPSLKEAWMDLKYKYELINEILILHGLEITDDMSRGKKEEMEIKRQNFVIQRKIDAMSIDELENFLQKIKNSQS
jgi:hypothetical protein